MDSINKTNFTTILIKMKLTKLKNFQICNALKFTKFIINFINNQFKYFK